jgi:hypothetical protein
MLDRSSAAIAEIAGIVAGQSSPSFFDRFKLPSIHRFVARAIWEGALAPEESVWTS